MDRDGGGSRMTEVVRTAAALAAETCGGLDQETGGDVDLVPGIEVCDARVSDACARAKIRATLGTGVNREVGALGSDCDGAQAMADGGAPSSHDVEAHWEVGDSAPLTDIGDRVARRERIHEESPERNEADVPWSALEASSGQIGAEKENVVAREGG